MADVVKLVNTPDCGSGISWVRAPSFAPDYLKNISKRRCFYLHIDLIGPYIPKERSHLTEILKRLRFPPVSDIGQRMRAALRSVQT